MGPKEIDDRYATKGEELFRNPGTQVYEWLVQRCDRTSQVVFHEATFRGADGEVAGLVGAIQDITEVKRAEAILAREVARHQVFVRSQGGMGLLRIDRTGAVLGANQRFAEILGHAGPEDLEGKNVDTLWDDPRRWASLVASGGAAAGSVYRIEELRDIRGQMRRVGCNRRVKW
jgi:PAS domain-containing protein